MNGNRMNSLKEKVKKFCEDRDWDQFHNAKELSIGLSTEASELLQHFRFKTPEQVEEIMKSRREEIEDELADVLIFAIRFAQKYDVDMEEIVNRKLKKNEEKYPIETSKGSNKRYDE